MLLTPEILNLITSTIVGTITFGIVGIYHAKEQNSALGSVLYMIFYSVHIGLLYLILSVYPIIWLIVLIVVIYMVLQIGGIIYYYGL